MFGDKPKDSKKQGDTAILGNFTLTAQLPNGRSINVAGYVYDGESKESLDGRLDIMQDVIERQRARCEVPELEAKLESRVKQLEDIASHFSALEEKRKSGQTLSSQERLQLNNRRVTVEQIEKDIRKGQEAIEEAKERGGLIKKRAGARA